MLLAFIAFSTDMLNADSGQALGGDHQAVGSCASGGKSYLWRTVQPEKPMSKFDERQRSFESKFAHDEDLKFKATARRNKLLGLWAAGLLGKTGEDAEAYSKAVVRADFEEAGHEDVVRKLKADLGDKVDEGTIRAKLDEMLVVAKEQLARAAETS